MDQLTLSPADIAKFFLVFFRIAGIVISIPVLGGPQTPGKVKILLSLAATVMLFSMVPDIKAPETVLVLMGGIIKEVGIGLIIGFFIKLIFGAIEMAGSLTGFQMGFSVSNVFDPQTHSQVSIISQFYVVIATLVFLGLNMHHVFLMATFRSFEILPLMGLKLSSGLMDIMIQYSRNLFITSLKIAAPASVVLILTNAIMALVSKAVPRMNVFIVGYPVTIAVGLVTIGLTMPYFLFFIEQRIFVSFGRDLEKLIMLLG